MAGHHTAPVVFREAHQLEAAFASAARGGVRLVLHAEDQHVFDLLDSRGGDPDTYAGYEPHRPRSGAIVAVAKVVQLARTHGTKVHILHVSSAEETDLLVAAAGEGLPISFEVTGHHLSFTDHDTARRGPRTRLSPAIRAPRDRERLWQAVLGGEASTIGSDHAPHTVEEKNRPPAEAPPGLPGVQELAISVWTGMLARGMEPDTAAAHLARLMGTGPADLFDLAGKGRLTVGADADLALLDPSERWQMSAAHVESLCGWSAYEGWMFTGRFTTVVRAGRIAWDLARGTVGNPSAVGSRACPACSGSSSYGDPGRAGPGTGRSCPMSATSLLAQSAPDTAELSAPSHGLPNASVRPAPVLSSPPMSGDIPADEFRAAMASLAAPVTVVTCYDEYGNPRGSRRARCPHCRWTPR